MKKHFDKEVPALQSMAPEGVRVMAVIMLMQARA